jgi:hypothetical protein
MRPLREIEIPKLYQMEVVPHKEFRLMSVGAAAKVTG